MILRSNYVEYWLAFDIWVALMCEMEYLDYRALVAVEGRT